MQKLLVLLLLLPAVSAGNLLEADPSADPETVTHAADQASAFTESRADRAQTEALMELATLQLFADERQRAVNHRVATTNQEVAHRSEMVETFVADAVDRIDRFHLRELLDAQLQSLLRNTDAIVAGNQAEREYVPTDATISQPKGENNYVPAYIATATVAATAVVLWIASSKAAAPLVRRDIQRIIPIAAPLFTRFERTSVLEHPNREAMFALIQQTPGMSLQSLCNATTLSRTAVAHHLRLLEQNHVIVSKRVGRSRHYYENGGRYGRDQKEAYAVLQNDRSKDVARYIQGHPGSMQRSMCEALKIQPSIAHWHVRRLTEAGLVEPVREGRTVQYFPGATLQAIPL